MFRLKNLSFSIVLIASVLVIFSCGDKEPEPEDCVTTNLTYGNFAENLIDNNCATSGCHNEGTTTAPFSLHDYDSVVTAVGFGRIIGSINHDPGFSQMPKGTDKLSDCNIEKMEAWIAAGTPE